MNITKPKAKGKVKHLSEGLIIDFNNLIYKNINLNYLEKNEEKVVIKLDDDKYFLINDIGYRIWNIIDTPITVKGVVETLLNEYEVEKSICEISVAEFLGQLIRNKLITFNN